MCACVWVCFCICASTCVCLRADVKQNKYLSVCIVWVCDRLHVCMRSNADVLKNTIITEQVRAGN